VTFAFRSAIRCREISRNDSRRFVCTIRSRSITISSERPRADRSPVIVVRLHNARDFAAAGDRGGGRQRVRKRGSNPDATVESWVGSRSFQLQSLVEREFDARRAQPQPSRHGRQERHRQGHHQQRAGCRKVRSSRSRVRFFSASSRGRRLGGGSEPVRLLFRIGDFYFDALSLPAFSSFFAR